MALAKPIDREGNIDYEDFCRYIYEYRFPEIEEVEKPTPNVNAASHAILVPKSKRQETPPPEEQKKPKKTQTTSLKSMLDIPKA